MNITPAARRTQTQPSRQPAQKEQPTQVAAEPTDSFSFSKFYNDYKSAIHIGGGALIGAGIASYAGGAVGTAVVSAAGTGAMVGFLTGSQRQAVTTAGGAILGASIAHMAGVPGAAVMSAAGTGALIGWLIG